MTIRINQTAVDFTLEQETTFADLVESLRSWAATQGLAVLGVLADGKALSPADPTPLQEIREVDVEAVAAQDEETAKIEVLERYFSLLAQGAGAENPALVSELRAEYPEVRKAAAPLLEGWKERAEGAWTILDGFWDSLGLVAESASLVAGLAHEARREQEAPFAALEETFAALDSALGDLEDLGTLFHRGRDRDALAKILGLFTLLGDAGRRAPKAFADAPEALAGWTVLFEELQPFLQETEQALGAGDFVLLTDLLEYEVTPRLRGLKDRASRNFQP